MRRSFTFLLAAFSAALLCAPLGAKAYCRQNVVAQSTLPEGAKQIAQSVKMTPEILLSMARVGSFALSPDGKNIVYTVAFPDIKANSASTRLFTVGIDGKNRRDLTGELKGVAEPKWVESGRKIVFLASDAEGDMQLFAMRSDGSDLQALSNVEGGITGFLFSPNEKQVLYTKDIKFGKTAEDLYPDLPKATGRVVTDLMYKHWDEWVTTIPHPFLATIGEKAFTEGKDLLEGEPFEAPMKPFADLSDFSFSPDGNQIVYASRKKVGLDYSISTNSDLYLYDIATNKTHNLTEGMMGYDTHPTFSPDGKMLAWCSMERDGYESDLIRLFLLDMATGEKRYLTEGFECNVESPQWAPDGKSIYFASCVEALTGIYNVELGTAKIKPITSGVDLCNYIAFDFQNGEMVAARQSMLAPTDLFRIGVKKGEATALTAENRGVLATLGDVSCEKRMMATTTGEEMLVWVLYPADFDPSKKYPSILYCQGGPQDAISQFWSYRWNPRLMAEQGYIVILPNRHGVPSFGKAWNEQISGDYGGQNMLDYFTAADEMKKENFIDPDRMGCVGASYGGFSVFWLAGNHSKRFACFIAHAGIFNLEAQYLETEEKWFANWDMGGAPWEKDNAVAQRTFANSPHKFVDKWDAPILVIHGEKDYRILASQGMMAFDAARMRGIPTELLVYPDENHWILRPQNAVLWQRTFFGWLDRWLKK